MGMVEEGDVLDRVNPHTRRQLQFVGPRGDDLGDGKGSQATVVELAIWPTDDYVVGIEPNLFIDTEGRGGGSMGVSIFLMSELRSCHLGSKVISYILEISSNRSSRLNLASS